MKLAYDETCIIRPSQSTMPILADYFMSVTVPPTGSVFSNTIDT